MFARVLMVQGTGSHVGKSVVVAGLCRIFQQDGFGVAPFKAQNMSNNSYVTADGLEIGRAQAVQAEAARTDCIVEMNPVLLKPESDNRSQVVVLGKPVSTLDARSYFRGTLDLWPAVTKSLDKLRDIYEVVVIEGAGSPAEINLRETEIVNMKVALYADAPVILVGDINLGGVFASLVGTLELLESEERACIRAFVINKFRGDVTLLDPALSYLTGRTGVPVAGVVPYYRDIHIPEEDSVSQEARYRQKTQTEYLLDIAVIGHPHISNFDDFDPLVEDDRVRLRYVETGDPLGDPDLIILPGTKSTVADLVHLRKTGAASEVVARAHGGTPVMGICGGYQMLGTRILDPLHIESAREGTDGLGLLPVTTVFEGDKWTKRVTGKVASATGLLAGASDADLHGYEIHMGRTTVDLSDGSIHQPFRVIDDLGAHPEGAIDDAGIILGTYLHGLLHNERPRNAILEALARKKGIRLPPPASMESRDRQYDKLAELLRSSLDMDLIYRILGADPPIP